MLAVPRAPEAKKLLGESVEESRVKRVEKQQSRYRDRGGTFVPADTNPLLDILLARGVNGESPVKSPAHVVTRTGTVPSSSAKGKTKAKVAQIQDAVQDDKCKTKSKATVAKEKGKAKTKTKSSRQGVSKTTRGKNSKTQRSAEENQQPVAGPSKLKRTTTKQSARSTEAKSQPLVTNTDADDERPLGRPLKSKAKDENETELAPTFTRKHENTTKCKGKQSTKINSRLREAGTDEDDKPDFNGPKSRAKQTRAAGKKRTASRIGYTKTGQDTDNELELPDAEVAKAWKSKAARGKQKTVLHEEDERDVIDKPKKLQPPKVKHDEAAEGHLNNEEESISRPKGRKTTAKGKVSVEERETIGDEEDVDPRVVCDETFLLAASSPSPPTPPGRRKKSAAATKAAFPGSSKPDPFVHEGKQQPQTTKLKRPHIYISSDSESEDDVPLQRLKLAPRGGSGSRSGKTDDVVPAKRVRVDRMLPIDEEREPAYSKENCRGKDIQADSTRRKKTGDDSETEARQTDEFKQAPKAMKTAAAQHMKEEEHATSLEDTRKTKRKGGASTKAVRSGVQEEERVEPAAERKDRKAPRKRHKPEADDEGEEEGVVPGPPAERGTKRRRATSADVEVDVAVTQVRDGGKSLVLAKGRSALPKRDKHEEPLKENRKGPTAKKAANALVGLRKPMPRLSLFPPPCMADNSEDEIDFLR